MKIQAELRLMSELPDKFENIAIVVRHDNTSGILLPKGTSFNSDNYKGFFYLKDFKIIEEHPEQLTIADLINEAKEKDEEVRIRTEKVNELLQEMESILNRNSQLLEIYSIKERPKINVEFSLLRQYSNEHDYASLNDLGVVTVSSDIKSETKMSWEHLVEYEGYVGWFYQSDFTELTKQLSGE